jgi:hypothetical protein
MGFSECLQNNVDLSRLPFAYQNLKTKKPLTISTRKWLFYMVGPDGQQPSPTLLFLLH